MDTLEAQAEQSYQSKGQGQSAVLGDVPLQVDHTVEKYQSTWKHCNGVCNRLTKVLNQTDAHHIYLKKNEPKKLLKFQEACA